MRLERERRQALDRIPAENALLDELLALARAEGQSVIDYLVETIGVGNPFITERPAREHDIPDELRIDKAALIKLVRRLETLLAEARA